jgi:hypothetical protein
MLHLLRVFESARVAVDPRIRQVGTWGIGHLAYLGAMTAAIDDLLSSRAERGILFADSRVEQQVTGER